MIKQMLCRDIDSISDLPDGEYIYQEKIEGMRATFGPYINRLYTRNGNMIPGVSHIEAELAKQARPLDGELFLKGKSCTEISSQARSKTPSFKMEFHIFDIADPELTETERQADLDCLAETLYIKRVKTYKGGKKEMAAYLKDVLTRGGEGIIIRNPTDKYTPGINNTIRVKFLDLPDDPDRWDVC